LNTNRKLAYAISAILSGYSGATCAAAAADTESAGPSGIEEIVVTAQRRSESIQNVPITIQAITGAQLDQLTVSTFDDVIKYLPNVSFGTNGPGQGEIFMRGLSAGVAGNQSTATFASFPNVAVYLDDQSMQFPARNVDIYMVDMERIEVLEGPQGTLFGGGAQAGAIRYITNKPKLNVTEGSTEASYGTTAHGDNNSSVNATLNLPVIPNTLAFRAVIYNDRRGGYIDNVPSKFTRSNNDAGNYYAGVTPGANGLCPNGLPTTTGNCVPANNTVGNNYNLAQRASNPVTYTGARLTALYQINDDWSALIAQSYQNMEADGEFVQYPTGSDGQTLGPWQATIFSPAYDKDKFENTSLTVNGKVGDLKAVYTGGYLVRHVDQTQDYSNYTRSAYGFYYTCSGGPGGGGFGAVGSPNGQGGKYTAPGVPATCYSPITSWRDVVTNTHQSHEFRLSTPDDWRGRGIVGVYWEDFEIADNMNFYYRTIPSCSPDNLATALAGGAPCVANVGPPPGTTASDPSVRNDNTAFGEDVHRGYKQTAAFTSLDYDLIPKVLTLTGGTRYYRYSEYEVGSKYTTPVGCTNVPNGCYAGATSINAENENTTFHGFKSRGNLTWHITPDVMVYYTYSQGFRPGGFNRTIANKAKDANGVPQYASPLSYAPDSLTNNEIGFKTELLDHRLQVNGSVYRMNWDNVQFALFDPTILGNTTFVVNGPNYRVTGFELQVVARVTDGLTVQGSGSWNSATQTSAPCLVDNYATSPNLGSCITEVKGSSFPNPFGTLGSRPAFSPAVEFNLRARYDWSINEYKAFVMAGASHIGDMSNQPASYVSGTIPSEAIPTTTHLRYDQPGYTTYDASVGVAKDAWMVSFFGQNLSNSDASTFTSSAQFIKSEVPLRPRVLGVKIGYKF
jgi:outer membrane receptor protein involved in Fe transport